MKKILDFFGVNVIADIGKVVDDLFTSEEERIAAKNKILQVIKEKELELRAQSDQTDAPIDQGKLQLDQQTAAMRAEQFQERIAAQERQTQARIDAAMEREILKQQPDGGGMPQ